MKEKEPKKHIPPTDPVLPPVRAEIEPLDKPARIDPRLPVTGPWILPPDWPEWR